MGHPVANTWQSSSLKAVYPLLLRLCRSDVVSEDVASAVIARAWRRALETEPADGDALAHAVLNQAVAEVSVVEATRTMDTVDGDTQFCVAGRWRDGWLGEPVDVSAVGRDPALSSRASAAIERALETLPLRLRLLAVLREVEGWSAGRVATLTGLDARQQADLLRDAREHLARALEPLVEESRA
jgi:DNA-directed RNA polymerase specialized sigma24 family protein